MWVWVWIATTVLFLLLRAGGAIQSVPLVFFLSAVAGALFFSLDQLRTVGPAHPLLRVRQVLLVVLIVAIPPLIDPTTTEIENLPRLVLIVVAAVAIVGVWAVDAVWSGWRPRRLVNGFQWVLLAIVVWFGVTTLTSAEPRQSLLGRFGSYEGLILIAALAVLTSALAESFTFEALPALFRVVVASTVPVIVYGLIQIYGFDVDKHAHWDFIQWAHPYHNVFATFGNPNHLGGYIAIVLPLGVVTAVLARHIWERVALWAWVAVVVLVLLLQTAARGAWLGVFVGGLILGAGLLPRIRASARTVALVIAGGLAVAVVLLAAGSRFLGAKAAALFRFGSGSSVSQRYGYWSAAIHSAAHHPLVGTGPDTFAVTYTRYQDAALAKTLGSGLFVNGAHNIFFSWLSNEGVPGLLLLIALVALAIASGVRAWRSVRMNEDVPETGPASNRVPGEHRRYMVTALVAGLVGYFVQASFDVEQVATLSTAFVVLGLLGIVNRGLWPVSTLVSPLSMLRGTLPDPELPSAEEDPGYPVRAARAGVYGRSSSQARSDVRRISAALAVGALGLAAVGLTYWRADAMWRADHQAWVGTQTGLEQAITLDPWQPNYLNTLGEAAVTTYLQRPNASDALAVIQVGVKYLGQDVALDGDNAAAQAQYGEALQIEAKAEHSDRTVLEQALAALQRAKQDNPFITSVGPLIQQVQKSLGGG